MVGAEFAGQVFEDQFLIADVKMTAEFPTERWFWFDPPFHAGRSALLHKQPDDIWRIDLQLHRDADPAVEKKPENVRPRIARMLGHDKFEFEWISLYKFQCRRMDRFLHGRVIFAGDSAHQVSPFGARGANSGLEDAENLAWKLDRILRKTSPESLLESYHIERSAAADENIRESTRSTDFMAPRHGRKRGCARRCWRSPGTPSSASAWSMAEGCRCPRSTTRRCRRPMSMPGAAGRGRARRCLTRRWRARRPDVPDRGLHQRRNAVHPAGVWQWRRGRYARWRVAIRIGGKAAWSIRAGLAAARYDAEPGTAYLLRPDGYVAARFRHPTRAALEAALARASGLN